MDFLDQVLVPKKPKKPYAFILGHGLWNDLQVDKTHAWISQMLGGIRERSPYLKEYDAYFPKLFVGPNAAGIRKPEIFRARQGNLALSMFEQTVGPEVKERGFDFLGTYNATIQTFNPDGT